MAWTTCDAWTRFPSSNLEKQSKYPSVQTKELPALVYDEQSYSFSEGAFRFFRPVSPSGR